MNNKGKVHRNKLEVHYVPKKTIKPVGPSGLKDLNRKSIEKELLVEATSNLAGKKKEPQVEMRFNKKLWLCRIWICNPGWRVLIVLRKGIRRTCVASLNNDWFNSNKLNSINQGEFFFFFSFFCTVILFTVIKFRRKIITIESWMASSQLYSDSFFSDHS